jgi:exopolyphosphatase/pppGpp-phosphohydrolase
MSDIDAAGLLNMLNEVKRLETLTTKELASEASNRLPLLGPDCLIVDEVIKRLRKLAAWEIKKARNRH